MTSPVIRIHPDDNVVIARRQLIAGERLADEGIVISGLVPPGHKIATRAIPAGVPVRRYGQIIGSATRAIAPGEHVHVHNVAGGANLICFTIGRGEDEFAPWVLGATM